MLNLNEDQLLDDIVYRAEQSRFSYNLQNEEFRNLNTNLQTYLNDIKRIDNENRQLQTNIDQIRTNYLITLENHLKRLPEDFRQESSTLTDAHIERYKSKSRAKRFINEREELKKRIQFLTSNDKEQAKRLNNLQKQERLIQNEFKILNDQLQNLYNHVDNEKQTCRQAMEKVDDLQIQLEKISVERSKTEVRKKKILFSNSILLFSFKFKLYEKKLNSCKQLKNFLMKNMKQLYLHKPKLMNIFYLV
jgi:chromosome segregation ATPase